MARFIARLRLSLATALVLTLNFAAAAAAQTVTPSGSPTSAPAAASGTAAVVLPSTDPLGGLFTWIMGGGIKLVLFGAILACGAIALKMAASGAFGHGRGLSENYRELTHVVIGVFVFVSCSSFIFGFATILAPFWRANLTIPQAYCTNGIVC